jgi:hypothetical protein
VYQHSKVILKLPDLDLATLNMTISASNFLEVNWTHNSKTSNLNKTEDNLDFRDSLDITNKTEDTEKKNITEAFNKALYSSQDLHCPPGYEHGEGPDFVYDDVITPAEARHMEGNGHFDVFQPKQKVWVQYWHGHEET